MMGSLEEGIYSEIINVLLGCSGELDQMRCMSCTPLLIFYFIGFSSLTLYSLVSKLFLSYFASCNFCIRVDNL